MSYIYRRTSHANLQPSKTVTPTTSAQTVTPDAGYDGLQEVEVDAVTSAIDANIQPGNIKQGVEILGVTGTYEDLTWFQVFCATGLGMTKPNTWEFPDYITDALTDEYADSSTIIGSYIFRKSKISGFSSTKITSIGQHAFRGSENFEILDTPNCTTVGNSACSGCWKLKRFVTSATSVPTYLFGATSLPVTDIALELLVFGTLTTSISVSSFVRVNYPNVRNVVVGVGTAINLPFSWWKPTNVIAEGADAIAELNANIVAGLADRVADRTNDTALTITFGTALYNVLTAETLQAFTDKNWNVAYA